MTVDTESQIVEILKEGEAGAPVADLLRKHGISRPTYFNWRAKYGGVGTSELKRVKDLAKRSNFPTLAPEHLIC